MNDTDLVQYPDLDQILIEIADTSTPIPLELGKEVYQMIGAVGSFVAAAPEEDEIEWFRNETVALFDELEHQRGEHLTQQFQDMLKNDLTVVQNWSRAEGSLITSRQTALSVIRVLNRFHHLVLRAVGGDRNAAIQHPHSGGYVRLVLTMLPILIRHV